MVKPPTALVNSLLPYVDWTEEALRQVVVQAIEHASLKGLPGEHHFYITFRTAHPGVVVPARVLARYPHEMTIVVQHQFWDLKVDRAARCFSVGLSFGGVGSILVIPFSAITVFADPKAEFQLQFDPIEPETAPTAETPADTPPQVVSLDAFRRRPPTQE